MDREPQSVAELTKKLNKMLGIKTKLSTLFYLQIDGQMSEPGVRTISSVLC